MKTLQTLGWSTLLLATSAAAQDTVKCLDKPVNTTFIHHNVPYLVVDDESIKDQAQLDALEQGTLRFCTSHVTDMSEVFKDRSRFNQNISDWHTTNVTTMRAMFQNAKTFNQPISNWDTSNVTDMSGMFYRAKAFNQPIGNLLSST